jgi:hypothetical protein
MIQYDLASPTLEHVDDLTRHMRAADRAEIWASGHWTAEQAILLSLSVTPNPVAALADGRCMGLLGIGVSMLMSRHGSPWLLGHEELPRHAKAILRISRRYIEEAKQEYCHLYNFVDARNQAAIRWLRWLGFDILNAQPCGIERLPFHKFEWRRPDEAVMDDSADRS